MHLIRQKDLSAHTPFCQIKSSTSYSYEMWGVFWEPWHHKFTFSQLDLDLDLTFFLNLDSIPRTRSGPDRSLSRQMHRCSLCACGAAALNEECVSAIELHARVHACNVL